MFYLSDAGPTEIYTLSLHDALPIFRLNPDLPPKLEDIINKALEKDRELRYQHAADMRADLKRLKRETESRRGVPTDRKSTRLNSSHPSISYAVFCLKKKKG